MSTAAVTDPATRAHLDPARLLAEPAARDALAALGRALRASGYDNRPGPDPLGRLVLGHEVPAAEVEAALGPDAIHALEGCGALAMQPGGDLGPAQMKAGFTAFASGNTITLLPSLDSVDDHVYFGSDSIRLLQVVWQHVRFGHRAADLGTGNGFLAAALATRFDFVIAVDLSPRCAATAALLPILNPQLKGRVASSIHDVSGGLRPGSFDVVVANSPWVPEVEWVNDDGEAGPPRRFAAGGPTGFELPTRFLHEGAALLAPGGQFFLACLDLTFADGRRPLHAELERLDRAGFGTEVLLAEGGAAVDLTHLAQAKVPDVDAAHHVVARVVAA